MSREALVSFSQVRRWRIGLSVLLSVVAALGLVLMANYLAARYPKRMEINPADDRALTTFTKNVLQGLTNQVKVIAFFNRRNALYDPVMRLLRQYELQSSRVEVERVDYEASPGRAAEILKQFKQDASETGDRVLFISNSRTEVVHEGELSEYENATQAILSGQEVQRTGFRGEQLFTSAIFSITYGRSLKAYFLQGHREDDPANDKTEWGYAEFARVLSESSVGVAVLELNGGSVPQDCQLLVIVGAKRAIPEAELQEIDRYLKRGGRLLALFNFDGLDERGFERSRLDRLLAEWGVDVGRNKITDRLNAQVGAGQQVLVRDFGPHPIAKPLRRSRVALALPRTVRPRSAPAGADAPTVTGLLFTSADGVATRADSGAKQELAGQPLCLAVAVDKGNIQGISADRGITRMVVIGDSLLFGNGLMGAEANRDFARNVVNWLLNQELLIEKIGPRPLHEYKLILSEREMSIARWVLLAGMPGSVLVLGWLVWLRRRS